MGRYGASSRRASEYDCHARYFSRDTRGSWRRAWGHRPRLGPCRSCAEMNWLLVLDGNIVDEPRRAEPCRSKQADRPFAPRSNGRERLRMTRLNVINRKLGFGEIGAGRVKRRLDWDIPRDRMCALAKRCKKARRTCALFGRQINISGGEREPVFFTHRGRRNDFRFEIEVARQLRDHLELLEILFAKDREIGPALVQKLCDDG